MVELGSNRAACRYAIVFSLIANEDMDKRRIRSLALAYIPFSRSPCALHAILPSIKDSALPYGHTLIDYRWIRMDHLTSQAGLQPNMGDL